MHVAMNTVIFAAEAVPYSYSRKSQSATDQGLILKPGREEGMHNALEGRKSSVSSRWRNQTRLNEARPELRIAEFLYQSKPDTFFMRGKPGHLYLQLFFAIPTYLRQTGTGR